MKAEFPARGQNELVVEGLGARVRIRVTGPDATEFTDQLRTLWSRCLPTDSSADPDDPDIETICVDLTVNHDAWKLLERVTRQVTVALLQQQAGSVLLFHAGGVSHPITGRSVAYVARSHTGKTRLTLELGRHFGYLSDESIALTDDFSILPYPKPLSVRDPRGGPRKELSPDALHLRTPPPQSHLTHLLLLDRQDAHTGPPIIDALDIFDAAALLAPQTSWLSSITSGLHRLDALLQHTGGTLRVTYREASTLVPLIVDLLGEPNQPDPASGAPSRRIRLVTPTDTLTRDGETLLLYDDHVVRLGALGSAIITASRHPISLAALTGRLSTRFGSPETTDAAAATVAAVEQLVAEGVLFWVDERPHRAHTDSRTCL